jgi:nucleoid-associated protein YgaU
MKFSQLNYLLLIATAGMLTGCVTYQSPADATRQAARQREEARQSQERLRSVSGNLETLQMELERLSGELERMRQLRDSDVTQLDAKIDQLAAAQARDKKEIVAVLGKQIEKLLKDATASAPAHSGGGEYVTEHVVRGGETLSAIAKAYNVSSKSITDFNKLQNPNRLTVGQKLLIPQ